MNKATWSPIWHQIDNIWWSISFSVKPIRGGSNTKLGDQDSTKSHNHWLIELCYVEGPKFIRSHELAFGWMPGCVCLYSISKACDHTKINFKFSWYGLPMRFKGPQCKVAKYNIFSILEAEWVQVRQQWTPVMKKLTRDYANSHSMRNYYCGSFQYLPVIVRLCRHSPRNSQMSLYHTNRNIPCLSIEVLHVRNKSVLYITAFNNLQLHLGYADHLLNLFTTNIQWELSHYSI